MWKGAGVPQVCLTSRTPPPNPVSLLSSLSNLSYASECPGKATEDRRLTTGALRTPSPSQPVPTSPRQQKLTENSPSKDFEQKEHPVCPGGDEGLCSWNKSESRDLPAPDRESSRPRHWGERQRPLTNNISSFNLLFRLGRLQPQRAELLKAMAVVAEALSGLHHSRKFTKHSLVSKQALTARGLALDYCAGPGVSGTKLHRS